MTASRVWTTCFISSLRWRDDHPWLSGNRGGLVRQTIVASNVSNSSLMWPDLWWCHRLLDARTHIPLCCTFSAYDVGAMPGHGVRSRVAYSRFRSCDRMKSAPYNYKCILANMPTLSMDYNDFLSECATCFKKYAIEMLRGCLSVAI